MLQSKNIVLVNIPPGCTSKVQPLDVSINKTFKDYLRTQFEKHRDENIELYISNNMIASKRRVLVTKWVAEPWEKIKTNKEMIIRTFTKCGITTNEEGSENHLVHIEGISYVMPQPEGEFHLETSSDEDSDNIAYRLHTMQCHHLMKPMNLLLKVNIVTWFTYVFSFKKIKLEKVLLSIFPFKPTPFH